MFKQHPLYINQIENASSLSIEWERFENKTFFITGASGLIGTFLVDILMHASRKHNLKIKIIAVGRNENNARDRFNDYWGSSKFVFLKQDVNNPINTDLTCDYIIHGASNCHPLAYSTDAINTITANVIGTQNILEYAAKQKNTRTLFISSADVYGENNTENGKFDELSFGYINCNTLRAGYPEGKRAGEALCQAYIHMKNLDIVIARPGKVYGPTMTENDSKATAQFIRKAAAKENIVLKSKGDQLFSYVYGCDAAMAIVYMLLYAKCGEAYNVADDSETQLKDIAGILSMTADTKVIYELPDKIEAAGYTKTTNVILDNNKLKKLGWSAQYDIKNGFEQTVEILYK